MYPPFFRLNRSLSTYSFGKVFRPLLPCPAAGSHTSYLEHLSTFNLIQVHFHFLTQATSYCLFSEFWDIADFQILTQGQFLKYKPLSLF